MTDPTQPLKEASIGDVFAFFSDNKSNGYTMGQFSKEWKTLDEKQRKEIRTGIGNGSLTY